MLMLRSDQTLGRASAARENEKIQLTAGTLNSATILPFIGHQSDLTFKKPCKQFKMPENSQHRENAQKIKRKNRKYQL